MTEYRPGDVYTAYLNLKHVRDKIPIDADSTPTITIYNYETGIETPVIAQDMVWIETGLYYYNWNIPSDADIATYVAVITAVVDGKTTRGSETFTVNDLLQTIADDVTAIKVELGITASGQGTVPVSGTVLDNVTNLPINEVTVLVTTTDNEAVVSFLTQEDGAFTVYVDPGEYYFEFRADGYYGQKYRNTIPDESSVDYGDVKLPPVSIGQGTGSETLTYQVTDENLAPIEGALIRAFNRNDFSTVIAQHTTDATGYYTLFLDPGLYSFIISKADEGQSTKNGTVSDPDTLTWD